MAVATKRDFSISYGLQTDKTGSSTGNTLFVDQVNDRVGVGQSNPAYKLDVNGDLNFTGSLYQNGSLYYASRWTLTGSDIYRLSKVGINETNPGSQLAVNGYITESTDSGTTYWNVVTQQDIGTDANQVPLNQYLGQLAFLDDFSPNGLRREGGSVDDVVVDSNGDVGIGDSNPDQKLVVAGNIRTTGSLYGPSNFIIDPSTVGDDTGTVEIKGNLVVQGTTTTINSTTLTIDDKNIVLASGAADAAAADGSGITVDGASATLTYASTGDKWVFNKAPYYNTDRILTTADEGTGNNLDADTVDGIQAASFLRSDAADTGTGLITLNNGLHVTSGNVGINTNNPQYNLEVNGSFAATTKSFVIDHPTKEGMRLRYGSLESPYHGVRLTGSSIIKNGKCIINLPDYIHNLVKKDGINIHITNIKHGKILWVEEVNVAENNFVVMTEETDGNYEFYWDFTAIRKDIEDMVVEF